MKSYTMYVCENCKKESRSRDEIYWCEATHLGLSYDQKKWYDKLLKNFKNACAKLSTAQNDELLKNQDIVLELLESFEKNHGLKDGKKICE